MAKYLLTEKQQAYRKTLLGHIHCAPIYLEVYKDDRPAWEAFLTTAFNVNSSAALRIDQLLKLRDFLNGKSKRVVEHTSRNQSQYIERLWYQRARNKDMKSLLAFARKHTGLTLISLNALSKRQASGIIAAIHRM